MWRTRDLWDVAPRTGIEEGAAIAAAVAAVAGTGATIYSAANQPKAPKPIIPQQPNTQQQQLALARADALQQAQRRSLLSSSPTGELGVTDVGAVQKKTLLGA